MKNARIELHLHLDGSLDLPWAYKKSIERGVIPRETTFEEYYNMIHAPTIHHTEEGFKKFDLTCAVMQTAEDLEESIYNLIKQLDELGLYYAEIRYASQQHMLRGLSQKDTIRALIKGMERAKKDFPNIDIGLINCLMHKGENALANMDLNFEAIERSREFLGKGLVGMDLAGYENNGDFMLYAPLFEKCREYGIPYTIHAGEMGEGAHMPMAIKMGAWRIGHGVNCVQKEEWLKEVVDKQIPLEVCVTSNCGAGRNYAAHPIRQLIAAGAKVTLNSDNMMFSRTNICNEHYMLKCIGVTDRQLRQCTLNAVDAAFCSDEIKAKLYKKLEADKI